MTPEEIMQETLRYESEKGVRDYMRAVGKTILRADELESGICLHFDGFALNIWDDGQDCCEARYSTSEDSPSDLVGRTFTNIAIKDGPEGDGGSDECHEQVFVEIHTDRGVSYTMVNHNEHNGYYGGFNVTWRAE